jgi:hypothetical protein
MLILAYRASRGTLSYLDIRSFCIVITPVLFFIYPDLIPYLVYQLLDDLATTLWLKISTSPPEQSGSFYDNHIIWGIANSGP